MLAETISYRDYNGTNRTETFYFNLTRAEVTEMEFVTDGTLSEYLKKIVDSVDAPLIMKFFKNLILKAYGEKSPDGRRLVKSEEISTAFSQTEAFSDLYMRLVTDANAAAAFVNGILPADMSSEKNKAAPLISKTDNEEITGTAAEVRPLTEAAD